MVPDRIEVLGETSAVESDVCPVDVKEVSRLVLVDILSPDSCNVLVEPIIVSGTELFELVIV